MTWKINSFLLSTPFPCPFFPRAHNHHHKNKESQSPHRKHFFVLLFWLPNTTALIPWIMSDKNNPWFHGPSHRLPASTVTQSACAIWLQTPCSASRPWWSGVCAEGRGGCHGGCICVCLKVGVSVFFPPHNCLIPTPFLLQVSTFSLWLSGQFRVQFCTFCFGSSRFSSRFFIVQSFTFICRIKKSIQCHFKVEKPAPSWRDGFLMAWVPANQHHVQLAESSELRLPLSSVLEHVYSMHFYLCMSTQKQVLWFSMGLILFRIVVSISKWRCICYHSGLDTEIIYLCMHLVWDINPYTVHVSCCIECYFIEGIFMPWIIPDCNNFWRWSLDFLGCFPKDFSHAAFLPPREKWDVPYLHVQFLQRAPAILCACKKAEYSGASQD